MIYHGTTAADDTGGISYSRFVRDKIYVVDKKSQLPVFRHPPELLPINVRLYDGYLGACWMAYPLRNLVGSCPFNTHRDGFPYPDRAYCGISYQLRANQIDFPKQGVMAADLRIPFIQCGTDNDGDVVFLDGENCKVGNVTEHQWCISGGCET